jgi:hypothetical protein
MGSCVSSKHKNNKKGELKRIQTKRHNVNYKAVDEPKRAYFIVESTNSPVITREEKELEIKLETVKVSKISIAILDVTNVTLEDIKSQAETPPSNMLAVDSASIHAIESELKIEPDETVGCEKHEEIAQIEATQLQDQSFLESESPSAVSSDHSH